MHPDIHEHDVRAVRVDRVDGLLPQVDRRDNLDVGDRREHESQALADERVVVDEEDTDGTLAHARPPS